MVSERERVAFTQVLNILNNIEKEYYDKIPSDTIQMLENNKIEYYQYYDEKGQTKLSDLAKQILCYLNLEYWCSQDEKKELKNIYEDNDIKASEKYSIDNIFNIKKETINNAVNYVDDDTKKELIEYKENWIRRLLKRIIGK